MTDARPIVMAVDDDDRARARLVEELEDRYGAAYRVECLASAAAAIDVLTAAQEIGEPVAVVLADQWMPDSTGEDLLIRARELHPRSKRALLIDFGAWGDPPTAEAIRRAMALGHIDYYVLKPWRRHDELFHRTLGEFLHEWAAQRLTRTAGDRGRRRSGCPTQPRVAEPVGAQRCPARVL